MNRTGEMNDDDVLAAVRGSVDRAAGQSRPPLEAIVARGRARQRRRLAGASLAGAAAAVAVAVGVTGAVSPSGAAPAAGKSPAHLAAFTVVSNPDGTTTLSISATQLFNPGALHQALAARGIPALVTDGSFCSSVPVPPGFSQVVKAPGRRAAVPPHVRPGRVGRFRAVLVINGSAMPAGTELSIGYFGGHLQQASVVLIDKDSYSCTSVRPATPPPGGLMAGWLHR